MTRRPDRSIYCHAPAADDRKLKPLGLDEIQTGADTTRYDKLGRHVLRLHSAGIHQDFLAIN
jgi:hypothetical protein